MDKKAVLKNTIKMLGLIKEIKNKILDSEKHLKKLAGEKDSEAQAEEKDYIMNYINELYSLADDLEKKLKKEGNNSNKK